MVTTKTKDHENRLTQVESRSDAPAGSKLKLLFTCGIQGQRIGKAVSNWVSGDWQLQSTNRCLYDGWNLIAILSPDSSLLAAFTWRLDLSDPRFESGAEVSDGEGRR